jgi:hypothetical protein
VWVKINDDGYEHLAFMHRKFYDAIGIKDPFPEMRNALYYRNRANSEGFTKMQMHSFLSDFGNVSGIGRKMFYSTNIRFDSNDMEVDNG